MSRIFTLIVFVLSTLTISAAQASTCCAHWSATGECYHEYTCSESSTDSVPTTTNDEVIYSRNEDGNLTRSCCAHWSATGECYHEYQCK